MSKMLRFVKLPCPIACTASISSLPGLGEQ